VQSGFQKLLAEEMQACVLFFNGLEEARANPDAPPQGLKQKMGKYFPLHENSLRLEYDRFSRPTAVRSNPLEDKFLVRQPKGAFWHGECSLPATM